MLRYEVNREYYPLVEEWARVFNRKGKSPLLDNDVS
jgi:hypothetical protein